MRIRWNELEAARIAEPHMPVLFPVMDADNAGQISAAMEKMMLLPEEVQCALGFMRCLLESSAGGAYSAYGRYCVDTMRSRMGKVPMMRFPLSFIGWGGKHNEIGPAYEMDRACLSGKDSRFFYTDEDILDSADTVERLAHSVAQASSGIADVRCEKLEELRTMNGDIRSPHWCVTFRMDDAAAREIFVNGQPVKPESGKAIFILPKAGEFDCLLGEVVDGDPDNAFILARHQYCMK